MTLSGIVSDSMLNKVVIMGFTANDTLEESDCQIFVVNFTNNKPYFEKPL
jgi:hypothetical protein